MYSNQLQVLNRQYNIKPLLCSWRLFVFFAQWERAPFSFGGSYGSAHRSPGPRVSTSGNTAAYAPAGPPPQHDPRDHHIHPSSPCIVFPPMTRHHMNERTMPYTTKTAKAIFDIGEETAKSASQGGPGGLGVQIKKMCHATYVRPLSVWAVNRKVPPACCCCCCCCWRGPQPT